MKMLVMHKKLIRQSKKRRRYAPEGPGPFDRTPKSFMMFDKNGSDFWDYKHYLSRNELWDKTIWKLELAKKQEKKAHKSRLREAEATLDEIHAAQELMKEIEI